MKKTPAELAREALRRYRESIDLEDATGVDEITETHLHVEFPSPPHLPTNVGKTPSESAPFAKLKTLLYTAGLAAGTGIVAAILQHCGH